MEELLVKFRASEYRSPWTFVRTAHGFASDSAVPSDHPLRKQMELKVRELEEAISRDAMHTRIELITLAIVDQGYAANLIVVEYGENSASIKIHNPLYVNEVLDRREGNGQHAVGVRGSLAGRIRLYSPHRDFGSVEHSYNFVDTLPSLRRAYKNRGMRETSSFKTLLRKIKTELTLITAERVAQARAKVLETLAHENKRHTRWDHQRLLEKTLQTNAERAFEILAESNITLPDDFKAAMSDYLDLKGILKNLENL